MTAMEVELSEPVQELVIRLNKDLKTAATAMDQNEVRLLVDLYYQIQDFRIASANIVRSQTEGEPNELAAWIFRNLKTIEKDISAAMGSFAAHYKVGQWLQSLHGVGPVISAGFLSHLDIRRAKTPGNFLSFAGLIDPGRQPWKKGQKRPWNAKLKTLATVRMGETMVKFSSSPKCFYGRLYAERKLLLVKQNAAGKFSEAAKAKAAEVGNDTMAYGWYSGKYSADLMSKEFFGMSLTDRNKAMKTHEANGCGVPMLPPAHIHSRARRYMAAMFVSHLHYVMWHDYHGEPYEYLPWVFSGRCTDKIDHKNIIMPPDWPNEKLGGQSLRKLLDKS